LSTEKHILTVELLLLFVEIADSFDLLCDGGSLGGCLGKGLLGAATFGLDVRIALGVAVGFLELDGLLPALLSSHLRVVEAAEEGLHASRLLPVRMVLRLLPWGPACCLRFCHATVEFGPTGGIPASRDGIEVVRNLWPPWGPTSLLFLCRCDTCQCTCGATITLICLEGRVDERRGRGGHDAFLLDLAGS